MTQDMLKQATELDGEIRDVNRILECLYQDYKSFPRSSYSDFHIKNNQDYSGYNLTSGMLAVIKDALDNYRKELEAEFNNL